MNQHSDYIMILFGRKQNKAHWIVLLNAVIKMCQNLIWKKKTPEGNPVIVSPWWTRLINELDIKGNWCCFFCFPRWDSKPAMYLNILFKSCFGLKKKPNWNTKVTPTCLFFFFFWSSIYIFLSHEVFFNRSSHEFCVYSFFFNKLTCEIFHTQFYLQVLACDMKIKCMKMLKTFEKKPRILE